MIADLNVHWDMAEDGSLKPHAHVMLTMRAVDENGFGPKVRDWNRTEMVERWRERWAEVANERLAELDIDARIDHRSLEAQGIPLEPQSQIGAPARRIEDRGIEGEGNEADRAEMHREIARGNGARIIADPTLGLDAITHQLSTFTRRDMAKFAHRHSDGIDQFNEVMGAMRNAPDLVELGKDRRGEDRFTTRDMIEAERRLHHAAKLMAERERHEVDDADRQAALARAVQRGLVLSGEQSDALGHITDGRDLGVVVGYAGTGKSAMLGVSREAWEAAGYEVRGVALSGIAAENFDGLRPSADAVPGQDDARAPEAPERKVAEDPQAALRKARTKALIRHARAVDAIFQMQQQGGKASPEQVKELQEARKVFEEERPYGSHDAEAAYKKNPELAQPRPRHPRSPARNRAADRSEPPRRPLHRALAKARPHQPASISGRRHVRLQGDALGDGRHGQKPRTRSATGIHPR
jgi:hypothetical protein